MFSSQNSHFKIKEGDLAVSNSKSRPSGKDLLCRYIGEGNFGFFSRISESQGALVARLRQKIAFWTIFSLLTATVAVSPAAGNTASGDISPPEVETFSVDMSDFQERLLAWSYFQALAERQDVMIIDVRSGFLPADDLAGLDLARPIPLEVFLPNFVARKAHQDKTLLIFDETGHELQRLQFHLRKHGYEDYFFLQGGAKSAVNR